MTCEAERSPGKGTSEIRAGRGPEASSLPSGTDTRKEELLSLGRDPWERCTAQWFSVDLHLNECERPAHHPGGCGPLREEDLDPEPYPVPDRYEHAAEMADARHDDAMVGLP